MFRLINIFGVLFVLQIGNFFSGSSILLLYLEFYREPIVRRDAMVSAFRLSPAASGRGLCDIDR